MSYRLRADETVEAAIARVAREQIDKAIGEIDATELDRDDTVHQVRKRGKKIRGLLRLVRPQLGATYRRENAWYRDAAGRLADVRDAQSMIETFDKLRRRFSEPIDRSAFASVRRRLTLRRNRLAGQGRGKTPSLDRLAEGLREARSRTADWHVADDGFDAVAGGLVKSYKRGRRAMARAYARRDGDAFHEWRKRAKYHGFHVRLLRPLWEAPMRARQDELKRLGDLLGDEHDLSLLREAVVARPNEFGDEATVQALLGLIDRRRGELRALARPLGERIYAEKPQHLARRLRRCWQAWQRQGDAAAPAAGPRARLKATDKVR